MFVVDRPLTLTPQSDPAYMQFLALPPVVNCPRFGAVGFVDSLAEQWNCTFSCGGDRRYWQPYKVGDIIPIQLGLPDIRNINQNGSRKPQIGWRQTDLLNNFWYIKADLYSLSDCNTPIAQLVDTFCVDWWVGYSNKVGYIQTLFIDTAMFSVADGFYLRIATIGDDLLERIVLYSEPFMRVDRLASCPQTLLLQSTYRTIDCEDRDYRTPQLTQAGVAQDLAATHTPFNASNPSGYAPTAFYSSVRVAAELLQRDKTPEKITNDNNATLRQTVVTNANLQFMEKIPPYQFRAVSACLFGDALTIDGERWDVEGAIGKELESGKMFLPNVPLTARCEIKNFC